MKRILFTLIVSFFLSLKAQASPVISSQEVDFDSPEGWGMSYMSSASLNLSNSFPDDHEFGKIIIDAEISSIPKLKKEQQRIGFGGFKYEDLNKSPAFGKAKLKLGFYFDSVLEFSLTPPIEINGAKPKNLYGVAISKKIFDDQINKLGLRLYSLTGGAFADVTCSKNVVSQPPFSEGNPSGCIGTSNDKMNFDHKGVEIIFARNISNNKFKPWIAVALTKIEPSVRIDAPLETIREIALVETKGTINTLSFGLNYELNKDWTLNLGSSYTPLDVNRQSPTGGNDNFWNLRIGASFKADSLFN